MATTESQAMAGHALKITRVFDAPRELVWKAWTDPEMAEQWMGPRGFHVTEFVRGEEAGARWSLTMKGFRPGSETEVLLRQGGVVKESRPPELLVYTFAWEPRSAVGLPDSPYPENLVTIRLEEQDNKTVVHFYQAPFATESERDGHNGGWNSALDCLAEFLHKQQPQTSVPNEVASELHLKRFFRAPRQLVFDAWTKPEMVAQWWGPHGFTTKVHQWEARGGGAIHITMGMSDGSWTHTMTGRFVEFIPPSRFHFTAAVPDAEGDAIFETGNSVFFEEKDGGTEVSLDVHVTRQTDAAAQYLRGMREGWNQSLDRLEAWTQAHLVQKGKSSVRKMAPFLWFDNDAEEAATFYLDLFPGSRKTHELRSKGVGPWPTGHIATISLEIHGQAMTFLNGGPGHPQTDAFSFFVSCETQSELDGYWDRILAAGGQEIACGWIRDRFGVYWQFVPANILELINHPKAMQAMMTMKRLDIAALEKAAVGPEPSAA